VSEYEEEVRDWEHTADRFSKMSLVGWLGFLLEMLCLLGLMVAGLVLLPFVGWFCVWKREPRVNRGGYYDHHG
jgi:hypothetical protein